MSVTVRGERELMRNLNREIFKIEGDLQKGLQAAGLFIKGKAIEMTPFKQGVLRGSAFYNTDKGTESSGGPRMRVGYTAKYAPYVHEMPEKNNFSTPDTGPKFLEKAIFNNTKIILEIIRKRAKR